MKTGAQASRTAPIHVDLPIVNEITMKSSLLLLGLLVPSSAFSTLRGRHQGKPSLSAGNSTLQGRHQGKPILSGPRKEAFAKERADFIVKLQAANSALAKGHRVQHNRTANNRTARGVCGSGGTSDGRPDSSGTPTAYCPYCRWCCGCNANDAMNCDQSTVDPDDYGGPSGVVVFCSTCESSCSSCPAFDDAALCPSGDCCANGWKHQPPFDATRGVGEYR